MALHKFAHCSLRQLISNEIWFQATTFGFLCLPCTGIDQENVAEEQQDMPIWVVSDQVKHMAGKTSPLEFAHRTMFHHGRKDYSSIDET
jgi:hypothetical protein